MTTLARATDPLGAHLVDCPPGHPSDAQERAVRQAEAVARARRTLPGYRILWRHVTLHAPSRRNGLTRFPDAGPVLVFLRDDLAPAECYRVALHELAHVADRDLILSGRLPRLETERRAELFAAVHEHEWRSDMQTDREALRAEGLAIADRVERRRGWTPADRSRAREIVALLDPYGPGVFAPARPRLMRSSASQDAPARQRFHMPCGGMLMRELPNLARCARCGAVQLGR
jgi:hypothetical protein